MFAVVFLAVVFLMCGVGHLIRPDDTSRGLVIGSGSLLGFFSILLVISSLLG